MEILFSKKAENYTAAVIYSYDKIIGSAKLANEKGRQLILK
jgi:hypothetical protein